MRCLNKIRHYIYYICIILTIMSTFQATVDATPEPVVVHNETVNNETPVVDTTDVTDALALDESTEDSLIEEFATKTVVYDGPSPSELITKLVPLFLTKSGGEFNTIIKKHFTAIKPNLYDVYAIKKQYNKFHRNAHNEKNDGTDYVIPSDRDRYNALMKKIVDDLRATGLCEKYLQYPDVYFCKMYDIFCSDETFQIMDSEFKKGARGILQYLSKVFNLDKGETLNGIDELMIMVKQYQLDSDTAVGFSTLLESSSDKIHMYARSDSSKDPSTETDEERMEFINSLAFPIFDSGINTLCFYEDQTDEKFTSFWITDKELGTEFQRVTSDEILMALTKSSFFYWKFVLH